MTPSPSVDLLLSRLEGVKEGSGGWIAQCPAHDDQRQSLKIDQGTDGDVLVHCHAGCATDEVVRAAGLEMRNLFTDKGNGKRDGSREIVATYPYVDERGTLLYEAVRFFPKDFRQRRPDGHGGWIWNAKGVRKVPYRLPEVIQAVRDGRMVFVVEGEKDADRLVGNGFVATSNVAGAGKWGEDLCEPFRGARVTILPDNDEPGLRHAEDVAAKLQAVGAEVRVLQLPNLPPKADVSDWLDAGYRADTLKQLVKQAPIWDPTAARDSSSSETKAGRLPPPMSVRELLALEEPEEQWIADGLILGSANLLMAAYPKSYKTFACLELAVSAITRTPFLGRFQIPRKHSVGMMLMEGSDFRTRKRLERICSGKGTSLADLDGAFHYWHRPPLKLNNPAVMAELAEYVARLDLDLLIIDNWSYVASGNSNDSDEVTPQLDALSRLREARPGLSVLLVHHARKTTKDNDADRLTDVIRNSSAFGAWYDVGLVLARANETSPVTVRAELRDHPSPAAFSFTVEDELPAGPESGRLYPGGWLRLTATDRTAEQVMREEASVKYRDAVIEHLRANPGRSKTALRNAVPGDNALVEACFHALCHEGIARYEEPARAGMPGRCYLVSAPLRVMNGNRAGRNGSGVQQGSHAYPADPAGTPLQRGSALGRDRAGAPHEVGASARPPVRAHAHEGGRSLSDFFPEDDDGVA